MTDNQNSQEKESINPELHISEQEDPEQEKKSNNDPENKLNSDNATDKQFKDQIENNSEEDEQLEEGLIESPISLKKQLKRVADELSQKNDEYETLTKKIGVIVKRFKTVTDVLEEDSLKDKKVELEKERIAVINALEDLENKQASIETKLKQFESIRRKSFNEQSEPIELIEQAEKTSPQSLFEDGEPIEHTLLYAVTFFPNLSFYDFERVVSFLLQGRTTTIKIETKITTEQGETQIIEESQEKLLVEIWQESLQYPDKFLSNCFITSVTLEDDSQVIDFVSPQLREKFRNYFKKEQFSYSSEQFKRARFLFFDQQTKVAIGAMSLSVEMAIDSPDVYGKEWLFEIITRWIIRGSQKTNYAEVSLDQLVYRLLEEIKLETRRWFVYGRISSLIAQMLDYATLQSVVNGFFNELIAQRRYGPALEIVKRLFSHPQFDGFYWLKQLLDRGDETIKSRTYKFLFNQLNQNSLYIYDLLENIKPWLPELGVSPQRYSFSNKYALRLLPEYCDQTIKKNHVNQYGNFPPQYSLLTPLHSSESIKEKLEILFAWLLHPEIESAIYDYVSQYIREGIVDEDTEPKRVVISSLGEENLDTKSPTTLMDEFLRAGYMLELTELVDYFVPFLLTEWCIILWGFDNKEPEREALELINSLLQQIFFETKSHQLKNFQEKLINCWNILTEYLLEKAEFYRESDEHQLRKQYLRRRNIVKYLKKQFKTSKKNSRINLGAKQ